MNAIYATNNSKPRELIPAGNYIARCYQMIHIGTVKELMMGQEKILNKVRIGWELPTEERVFKEGELPIPLVLSKEFTLSMHEKATLRMVLKSWRGKDFTDDEAKKFDITKLIGAPCMLNIIHKPSKDGSQQYATISGITPLPKGISCPKAIYPPQIISYENFDFNLFDSLPDFIKDKIKNSEEYQKMNNPHETEVKDTEPTDSADGLPF